MNKLLFFFIIIVIQTPLPPPKKKKTLKKTQYLSVMYKSKNQKIKQPKMILKNHSTFF